MSKLRSLSTSFWSDPFIEDLTPGQKLLFIYLITNDKTNMLGIYESSIKKISFETGIKKDEVEKALKAFEKVGKVKYINNYIILVNYMKHQNYNTNMKKAAIDIYNNLPKELISNDIVVSKSNPLKGFESLLNHYGMVRKVEVEYEDEIEEEVEIEKEEYVDSNFIDLWSEWLDYKKERKECYKTLKSKKAAYTKLTNLANNKPELAKAIIKQSIENNWVGMFEYKGPALKEFSISQYHIPNADQFGYTKDQLIQFCKEGKYPKK